MLEALYRTRYAGFTAKHFHEHLVKDHRFNWSYTWTKTFLQSKGLLEKARRRGAHRRKRPRRPLPGMLLHQDGSRHQWLAGQPMLDLIVTLDDATSAIYSAFLAALRAYIAQDDPAAAQRVALHIIRNVETLLPNGPEMGRPGRIPGTRELVIPRTPYIVPYRLVGNIIQVLRDFHGARRWPDAF